MLALEFELSIEILVIFRVNMVSKTLLLAFNLSKKIKHQNMKKKKHHLYFQTDLFMAPPLQNYENDLPGNVLLFACFNDGKMLYICCGEGPFFWRLNSMLKFVIFDAFKCHSVVYC